jgi:hypothetical protein
MADLVVVTPSRGRPQQLRDMTDTVYGNAGGDVQIVVGLDVDDPADYEPLMHPDIVVYRGERNSLCGWTNFLAQRVLEGPNPPRYLASLGDDHRPRTAAWDIKLVEAIENLDGPGFAYGNDLLQGKAMPTAWVTSAEIVRTLGWMMLPGCQHMYVDNAVLELGNATGRIVYRPDVVVEHLHPLAGKADWDESYRQSNAQRRYAADRAAFDHWKRTQLAADTATVKALPKDRS